MLRSDNIAESASELLPTFVVRELAVVALEEEVPKAEVRNLERGIEGFCGHGEDMLKVC
jgi:hypothetical protein